MTLLFSILLFAFLDSATQGLPINLEFIYILGTTTIYEYFFANTFTGDDFIDSGWTYSGDDTPVTTCAGKSIVGLINYFCYIAILVVQWIMTRNEVLV